MTAGTPLVAGMPLLPATGEGPQAESCARYSGGVTLDAEEAMGTLRGGLWHTTSEERFQGIRSRKAVLSKPPLREDERWGTLIGPEGWPYVRTLGNYIAVYPPAGRWYDREHGTQ